MPGFGKPSRHSRVATYRHDAPGFLAVGRNTFLPRCQYWPGHSCLTQGPNYDVCSGLLLCLTRATSASIFRRRSRLVQHHTHSALPRSVAHIPTAARRQTGCLCPRLLRPCPLSGRCSTRNEKQIAQGQYSHVASVVRCMLPLRLR